MKNLLLIALVLASTSVAAQKRCVPKEYAQYKDQVATAKGRYNLPVEYCIAEVEQRGWATDSQPYADCSAEMSKMKDALVRAQLPKLVAYAEAGCGGTHPLDKAGR